MKKSLMAVCLFLSVSVMMAQQKQGTVNYERVTKMLTRFNINGVENEAPQSRKENYELIFGNNQSIWKAAGTGK